MDKSHNAKDVTDAIYKAGMSSHKIETKVIGKTREVPDKYKRNNPVLSKNAFTYTGTHY